MTGIFRISKGILPEFGESSLQQREAQLLFFTPCGVSRGTRKRGKDRRRYWRDGFCERDDRPPTHPRTLFLYGRGLSTHPLKAPARAL